MSSSAFRLRNLFLPAAPLVFLLCPQSHSAEPAGAGTAPARNWVLPLFTKEGYHSTTLSGDEVNPVGADRIDVINIKINNFSGDAATQPTSTLISTQASYFSKEKRASGPADVHLYLFRDNAEITGEDWSYEQVGEKISIHRHVRVVFQEKINSLLK